MKQNLHPDALQAMGLEKLDVLAMEAREGARKVIQKSNAILGFD